MKIRNIAISCALLTPVATATDINLSIQSAGSNAITVAPGGQVSYQVVAELSDAANEGLGLLSLDLSFEGGALSPANSPAGAPMNNFDRPLGMTNPIGFGGTPSAGKLLQVGGAQNTWNNTFAPVPMGTVITNIAKPGNALVVVSGTLNAPMKVGDFKLTAENILANVISQGQTGMPFWKVEAAGVGSVTELTVTVSAISADIASVSVSVPGAQTMTLDAGLASAGRSYMLLGSVSGTAPGLPILPNITIPLNYDIYTDFTVAFPNSGVLNNSFGTLDGQGMATAKFNMPANAPASVIGIVVNHAYVLLPVDFVSEAEPLTITP